MQTLHDTPGDFVAQIPVGEVLAADATSFVAAWRAPYKCSVVSIQFYPTLATTGDDTNTKNLNAHLYDGTPAEVANIDLASGVNLVAGTPKTLAGVSTSSPLAMASGDCLFFEVETVADGVLIGAGSYLVTYRGA